MTEIYPIVQAGRIPAVVCPFMTLEPMTARPDHMDPAGGRGAVELLMVPRADPMVRIGKVGRLQAVAQETGHRWSAPIPDRELKSGLGQAVGDLCRRRSGRDKDM